MNVVVAPEKLNNGAPDELKFTNVSGDVAAALAIFRTPQSELSRLPALCVAAVADVAEARILFRQLLIWALSMSIVGAILCQTLAGAFARA